MASTIQGRIGALARAHLLIRAGKSESGTPREKTLDVLIRAILAPYLDFTGTDGGDRAIIKGPEALIGGDAATSLALVFHELATNAAKYGAFLMPSVRVYVSWTVTKKTLSMVWKERGGPAIQGPPARDGFGSMLARRSVMGQLSEKFAFDWQAAGLTVKFSAAMERLLP